jgi:ABC-type polysaccharide/polyol phosphate transport system ATPase subunit
MSTPGKADLAVSISEVGKRFKRHTDRRGSLKELIVRGRAKNEEDFWAVRDVTIDIPKGSVYGLIGHNGSGKSTLLKMIGGIYRPTTGSIVTDGRVAALIELGAGFHPDMSPAARTFSSTAHCSACRARRSTRSPTRSSTSVV